MFDGQGQLVSEQLVQVDDAFEVNAQLVRERLAADLAAADSITATAASAFTQAGVRDLQRQVKELARMNKRLIRLNLALLDSAD